MRPGTSSALAENVEKAGATGTSKAAAVLERWAAPVVAALLVGLVAVDQGGYFPTSWGWGAFGALWVIGLWLVIGACTEARSLDFAIIVAFAGLAAWTASSVLWSESTTQSVLEAERAIFYVSTIAAVLLLVRRRALHLLVGAILVAIAAIAAYSLCTRIFPDRLGSYDAVATYRLAGPIGYWNGLGIFTVVGVFLALAFAARARLLVVRLLAAASLPVMAPTLYLTFSRASAIVLGIGLLAAIVYDTRRLQLASTMLLLAPAPALATILAGRSRGLTHAPVPLWLAVHDGHRLAKAVVLLVPAAAVCMLVQVFLERRLHPPRVMRFSYAAVLLAAPVTVAIMVSIKYGGPAELAGNAYRHFRASPGNQPSTGNLNSRFLSFTSNGRVDLWHVAWKDYTRHSALGSGAGTFAREWFRSRPAPVTAQDAHNLYVETLAELGPVGLVLLLVALGVPLLAALRARGEPFAALLLGAYVAFLVHAGVDWDFELPGVSLAALLCGGSLIVAARGSPRPRALRTTMRGPAIAVTLVVTAVALVGLIGNSAVAASDRARESLDFGRAETQARKARWLMPWSSQPWVALGTAQYARGDVRGARASYRHAVAKDPGDWTLWLDLAVASRGDARTHALARAHRLNPLGDLRSQPGPRESGR